MSDLLTEIHRDIAARMDQLRPAVTEYTRLQEARAALTGTASPGHRGRARSRSRARGGGGAERASATASTAQSAESEASSSTQGRSKPAAGTAGRPRAKRAARGANQAAVVAALREQGQATVPQLAEATKVKPAVLYALTRVLVDKGVLSTEKTNGRRTFALA
jgi:hypothetical protein